jgi:hypothetical protein
LEDIAAQIEAATAEAEQMWSEAPAERLLARPGAKNWSAAECLEHLNITARAFLPRLERALEGMGAGDGAALRMEPMARLLEWWLEPPSRLKAPTVPPFFPGAGLDAAAALAEFAELQARWLRFVEAARRRALDSAKIQSPFAEKVRYNCYSALLVALAHTRRHLWQARRAADSAGARIKE